MKELDIRIQEDQLAHVTALETGEVGVGGRRPLPVALLLETEARVKDLGHHGAAEHFGICYHAVRHRMRRLTALRTEQVKRLSDGQQLRTDQSKRLSDENT